MANYKYIVVFGSSGAQCNQRVCEKFREVIAEFDESSDTNKDSLFVKKVIH